MNHNHGHSSKASHRRNGPKHSESLKKVSEDDKSQSASQNISKIDNNLKS